MLVTIFNAFLPVFLNGVLGFVLRARGWFGGANEDGLIKSLVAVFYPAFIVASTLGQDSLRDHPADLLIAPLLGYLFITIGFLVAMPLARPFGIREPVSRRSFAFATGIFNFGYLTIPLVTALYGTDALPILFLFNAGVDLAIWTVGILTLTGSWNRHWYRKALNPPFVAIIVSVALTVSGLDQWIPEAILGFARQIGVIAIPLGLLLTGSVIHAELRSGKARPESARQAMIAGSVIRLGILPILLLLVILVLPLPERITAIAVVQAAMPTGVFTIVLTRFYGGRPEISLRSAIPTQILAFATTPFWIWVGMQFVV